MYKPKIYYAIYDGMEQKLITFVEKERTKKPLISGGGNLGFIKLVSVRDYEYLEKENAELTKEVNAWRQKHGGVKAVLDSADAIREIGEV